MERVPRDASATARQRVHADATVLAGRVRFAPVAPLLHAVCRSIPAPARGSALRCIEATGIPKRVHDEWREIQRNYRHTISAICLEHAPLFDVVSEVAFRLSRCARAFPIRSFTMTLAVCQAMYARCGSVIRAYAFASGLGESDVALTPMADMYARTRQRLSVVHMILPYAVRDL